MSRDYCVALPRGATGFQFVIVVFPDFAGFRTLTAWYSKPFRQVCVFINKPHAYLIEHLNVFSLILKAMTQIIKHSDDFFDSTRIFIDTFKINNDFH